jgi:hypothetical protein
MIASSSCRCANTTVQHYIAYSNAAILCAHVRYEYAYDLHTGFTALPCMDYSQVLLKRAASVLLKTGSSAQRLRRLHLSMYAHRLHIV